MSPRLASRRLMILGAGPEQLPLIRRAIDRGHEVITVDYLPDNVGHRHSHRSVNASTVDRAAVLAAAAELHVDGITTMASDIAVPTVAHVAAALGLVGPRLDTAETMHHKGRFRTFQHARGLPAPRFVEARALADVRDAVAALVPPVVFKPVDSSGSKGVGTADPADARACAVAFENARSFSRSGTVCIEEFVPGIDVSGNAFFAGGRPELAVLTRKRSHGMIPVGHLVPCPLPAADAARVWEAVVRHCDALGYTDGPLDFDARVAPDRVTILEMSPRLGGNCIPQLVEHATGCDVVGATVDHALRVPRPALVVERVARPCAITIFGSERAGRLVAAATAAAVRTTVPEAFEVAYRFAVGSDVPAFTHSGQSVGWVLFDCPDGGDYDGLVARIHRAVGLRVG